MVKRLILSHIFTSYLYYAICISKREYERLSKLLRITKWLSKLPHVGSAALLWTADTPCDLGTCLFSPFALIAPDACVVTCGYRLHSEIISRSHLLI